MSNEIVKIIEETGLATTQAEFLKESFLKYFDQVKTWEELAKTIKVTSADQVEEMKKARTARLALKDIRCDAENARKKLKEDSLRYGRAVDGIANVLKALVTPIENYFEYQEKFVERIEEENKKKKLEERINQLIPYVQNVEIYNLSEMSEQGFQELLENARLVYENKANAEKKAEEERLKREEENRVEQEKIRQENERLKAEALAREAKIEEERKAREIKEKAEAEEREKKLAAERAVQEEKLAEERWVAEIEKQRLATIAAEEAEARKKAEAEIKRVAEEARKQAEEETKRKEAEEADIAKKKREAELAPDRVKLIEYSNALHNVEIPNLTSDEYKEKMKRFQEGLLSLLTILRID